jgi:serine/threonine protein kinase
MWPGDSIAESMNLADALDFLHNGIFTETCLSLLHNDLTPHNTLVVYPDNHDARNRYPIGQWKIANFGLSIIKPRMRTHDTLSS